jgi:hypothetical protein
MSNADYNRDLSELTRELFNVEQLRKAFEQKYNVTITDLDLSPGTIVPNDDAKSEFDERGYHRTLGISRPDEHGFVRFKSLDEAIATSGVKGFPAYVSSMEALEALKLAKKESQQYKCVAANAAYVQFLGGWTGALSKNRATIFFASYTTTDPATGQTRLTSLRPDGCGFASTQRRFDGTITWQGPSLEEQESALLKAFERYVRGEPLDALIYGWVNFNVSGDFA